MDAPAPGHDPDDVLYARTWRLSGGPHPTREALVQILDHVAPLIVSSSGFRGGHILVERETGDVFATAFYATWSELEAAQAREANGVAGAQVLLDSRVYEVHRCDVLLSVPAPAVSNRLLGTGEAP